MFQPLSSPEPPPSSLLRVIILTIIVRFLIYFHEKEFLNLCSGMSKSISVPQPGTEPVVPLAEVQSLNQWTGKEVHVISLKILCVLKKYGSTLHTLFCIFLFMHYSGTTLIKIYFKFKTT